MSELGARASGQGRIFQTSGDQYIQEHHHHYGAGAAAPLFPAEPAVRPVGPVAPDSVRVPPVGRPPGTLRNREELRDALSAMLGSSVQLGAVVDERDRVMGVISVDQIAEMMRRAPDAA